SLMVEQYPRALIITGVEQGLAAVGDDAHERPWIVVAGDAMKRQMHGHGRFQESIAWRRAAQADQGALPDDGSAVRRDQVSGETKLPPTVGRLLLHSQGRRDLKLGRHPLSIV